MIMVCITFLMKNPHQFPREEPVSEAGRQARVWVNPAEAVCASGSTGVDSSCPILRTSSTASPLPAPDVEAGS